MANNQIAIDLFTPLLPYLKSVNLSTREVKFVLPVGKVKFSLGAAFRYGPGSWCKETGEYKGRIENQQLLEFLYENVRSDTNNFDNEQQHSRRGISAGSNDGAKTDGSVSEYYGFREDRNLF